MTPGDNLGCALGAEEQPRPPLCSLPLTRHPTASLRSAGHAPQVLSQPRAAIAGPRGLALNVPGFSRDALRTSCTGFSLGPLGPGESEAVGQAGKSLQNFVGSALGPQGASSHRG